jgi:hypothetical protein
MQASSTVLSGLPPGWQAGVAAAAAAPTRKGFSSLVQGPGSLTPHCTGRRRDSAPGRVLGYLRCPSAIPYTWCKSVCTGIYRYVPICTILGYKSVWYVLSLKSTYRYIRVCTFWKSTYQYIPVCSEIGISRYIPVHTGSWRFSIGTFKYAAVQ